MSTGAKLAIGGLIAVCCVIVVGLASLIFGGVTGEEFNPYTFQRRKFYFFEIPLLRWQVYPLVRSAASGDVEEWVETSGCLPKKKSDPEAWHLFAFRRSAAVSPEFDAAILKTYLDTRDAQKKYYWYDWSIEHPQMAKILWPAVARFARLNLYLVIPHFFQLAATAEDAQDLQTKLTATEIKWLLEHAARTMNAADYEQTLALCTAGLELDPQQSEFRKLREQARSKLGLSQQAEAEETAPLKTPSP